MLNELLLLLIRKAKEKLDSLKFIVQCFDPERKYSIVEEFMIDSLEIKKGTWFLRIPRLALG